MGERGNSKEPTTHWGVLESEKNGKWDLTAQPHHKTVKKREMKVKWCKQYPLIAENSVMRRKGCCGRD